MNAVARQLRPTAAARRFAIWSTPLALPHGSCAGQALKAFSQRRRCRARRNPSSALGETDQTVTCCGLKCIGASRPAKDPCGSVSLPPYSVGARRLQILKRYPLDLVGARGLGLRVQLRCPSDRPARCRVFIASSSLCGRRSPSSNPQKISIKLVGARGFEPPTASSQSWCATRLRYAPIVSRLSNSRTLSTARRRWLMRFFSSGLNSASVAAVSVARNTGS